MWDAHIAKVISKVTQVIGMLRRLKSFLPRQTLILIYKSLIYNRTSSIVAVCRVT